MYPLWIVLVQPIFNVKLKALFNRKYYCNGTHTEWTKYLVRIPVFVAANRTVFIALRDFLESY